MYEKEDQRSPFMVAIENNQLKVVKMLLVKDYSCPSDPKLLRRQMMATDKFGNNAMHKACRFRNPQMIDLLLKEGIGDLEQRNLFGKLPIEQPHNNILSDDDIKNIFTQYVMQNKHMEDKINLNLEADFMFVASTER